MSKYEIMAELAMRDEFVIVDLETSHFHPTKGGRIIEIGAVKIKNGKIVAMYSQLIDPRLKLSQEIIKLTGITNEDVAGKPPYWKVLPHFQKFIGDAVVVAHNSSFDWDRFLLYYFNKLNIKADNDVIDTMVLARKLLPKQSLKLGELCRANGIKLENAHRALDDAKATAALFMKFRKMIEKEKFQEQSMLFDIV